MYINYLKKIIIVIKISKMIRLAINIHAYFSGQYAILNYHLIKNANHYEQNYERTRSGEESPGFDAGN
jgi:hypothetical protein